MLIDRTGIVSVKVKSSTMTKRSADDVRNGSALEQLLPAALSAPIFQSCRIICCPGMYDDMGKMIEHYHTKSYDAKTAARRLFKLLTQFQGDVEEILERHGFESYENVETELVPRSQAASRCLMPTWPLPVGRRGRG